MNNGLPISEVSTTPQNGSNEGSSAIELRNVTKRFLTPTGQAYTAIRDINLSVAPGEFCAVVGPTGCGKSTTLGLISGLERPSEGSVQVMGKPVQGIDPRIGYVFQSDAVFPWKNVLNNVATGPLFRGQPKAEAFERAHEWIARVGLSGFEHHYPHQLSGGMRKRVALAQTFINEPQILLMDEPFSALDVQTRTLMEDELLQSVVLPQGLRRLRHPRPGGGHLPGRPRVRPHGRASHRQGHLYHRSAASAQGGGNPLRAAFRPTVSTNLGRSAQRGDY